MSHCDNNIIKLSIPGSILSTGGTRATGIYIKLGGSGTQCCASSNIIQIVVPPAPPPPTPPTPDTCLASGTDLYGYSAIVSYDPIKCGGGHACDRALFNFYIKSSGNTEHLIGLANLNNRSDGQARSGVFTINEHIVGTTGISFRLECATEGGVCHQGIGRVELKDTLGTTVFASCMPNDIANTNILCDDGGYRAYPCVASGVFTSQPTNQNLTASNGSTATFSVGINTSLPRDTGVNYSGIRWYVGTPYNNGAITGWTPLDYICGKESSVPLYPLPHTTAISIQYRSSDIAVGNIDPGFYTFNQSFPQIGIYDALFSLYWAPSGINTSYDGIPCSSNIVKLLKV